MAAEAEATALGLGRLGVHSLTLNCGGLGAKEFGAFLMLMELVVAAVGEALDINAFDQPGVELGKRLAREILKKEH